MLKKSSPKQDDKLYKKKKKAFLLTQYTICLNHELFKLLKHSKKIPKICRVKIESLESNFCVISYRDYHWEMIKLPLKLKVPIFYKTKLFCKNCASFELLN